MDYFLKCQRSIFNLENTKNLCQQAADFGGYRHSGSGDIMFSICHVILQDSMTRGSCDCRNEIPLW